MPTITFNTDGGSNINPITQEAGTDIVAPANPIKIGYSFVRWNPALPAKMPSQDLEVTAIWTEYEIIGETIKSATSIKLGQLFNNPIRYKENISKPKYPNFSIIQVGSPTPTKIGDNRYSLDYLINIQYRVAENTETLTNLQQQLDNMALQLSMYLTELNLGWPTKTYNRNSQKVDGVLQFFFNITVYAKMEEGELVLMQQLTLNEEVI